MVLGWRRRSRKEKPNNAQKKDQIKPITTTTDLERQAISSAARVGRDDDVLKELQSALSSASSAVLEELVIGSPGGDRRQLLEAFANLGAVEVVMGLVRNQTSPKVTKSSLVLIFHIFSSETNCPSSEKVRSEFLDMGLVSSILELLVEPQINGSTAISERALGVMDALCRSEKGAEMALENDLTIPVLVKKLLRVSDLATEFSVSAIWKLFRRVMATENEGEVSRSAIVVEALQVGAFQKLLLIIQIGCGDETREKATELLKMLNPYRPQLECIESVDFKGLKRSF